MAEVKKTNDPKQDLREKRGSIYKTAAVSAPIAIGGGIGISRLLKSSTHFTQPIERIPNTARSDQIREFANRYVSPEHSGVFKEWQLDKLAGFSDNTALSVEHVRSSMMRAAANIDPSGILSSMFDKRLAFAQTGKEAYADIIQVMRNNNSVYAQRAISTFLQDVNLLEQRAEAGLPVDTTNITPTVRRRTPYLHLGELDPMMRADVAKMEQLSGATVRVRELSRADIPGAELNLEFFRPTDKKDPWFNLRIPRVMKDQPGVITRGATQQSRYIAGQYGLVEDGKLTQSFNHEQWMARRATEELLPQVMTAQKQSSSAVRQAVHAFEQQMIEAPEWIPSMAPGTHEGLDEYVRLRSQVMRLYTPDETSGVRQINEFEFARIIERGGLDTTTGRMPLFPGHSPAQIAKGVASTMDPREIFLAPEAAATKRRPFQRFRVGYTPTPGALEAMGGNQVNQAFAWAADPYGVKTPMTRAAYVSGDLGPQLAGTGVTSEGQLLVSNRLRQQRAVRQWQQFDINPQEMVELKEMLGKGGASWDINKTVPGGTFLGYGPDGKPVVLPESMHLSSATAFTDDKAKGDFIRVMGMRDIERMRYSKVFGGAKGMAVEVSPDYIEQVLTGKAGMSQMGDDIYKGIDAVITMDELKKNRALHYNQMFTSLWDFTRTNMQSGKQISAIASNFANDPRKVIAQMRAEALQSGKFNHEDMLQNIVKVARGSRLDPTQMGRVFGAVPETFGGLGAMGALSAVESKEIGRGIATGATQLYFEGLGGPGSGKTATIEPRMFELLGAPHFGAVGGELQSDVAQRMIAAYPERLNEQQALNRAAASLGAGKKLTGARSVGDVLEEVAQTGILPQTGTDVQLPGGLGGMHIPGSGQVSQLTGYKTGTGTVVRSELADAYRGVLETAKQYEDRDITIDILNKEVDNLRTELNKARIGTVTGEGGLLRNRLPGSAFLTAVQPTAADQLAPGTVGITEKYAQQMFSEMEATGLYNRDELAAMQSRFMAGEEVAGAIGRHPYIGPYSTQGAKFKMIPGNEAVAMIDERQMRAVAIKGQLEGEALESFATGAENAFRGNQHALRRMEQVGAEMMGSPIRMSPFVGLAGDVDGDVVSAMFAGPQLEKSLSSHLANQDALKAYDEYAIRSQVLKAKGKGDAITIRKAMSGDIFSLGITEGGRLGKLSTSLQQYRGAVLSGGGGLSPQEQMNALGLLEWMEQTPISGKHIAPGQEEKMIYLLDDIQQALDKKSANQIADSARTVLAEAKMSGQAALREGFTVAMEDIGTGEVVTRSIPGLDIAKAADHLVMARAAAETQAVSGMSADRMRKLMMGRADMHQDEMAKLLQPSNLELSPFGAFFETAAPPGKLAQFASEVGALTNRLGAAGKKMIAHARPLAIGTGIGVGMAALLSEPPRVLGPTAIATPNLTSGTGGANIGTNIHPSTHVGGMPSAPTMEGASNTARITAPSSLQPEGYTINIHGAMRGDIDQKQLSAQLQAAMGGRSRVNSTIRDMRSSLTPQSLSSMLQD